MCRCPKPSEFDGTPKSHDSQVIILQQRSSKFILHETIVDNYSNNIVVEEGNTLDGDGDVDGDLSATASAERDGDGREEDGEGDGDGHGDGDGDGDGDVDGGPFGH